MLLLGSITLIPPTVFMKPSSYLKVTVNMYLIITFGGCSEGLGAF